jgi:soluble lytic murein transglycosylase
LDLSTGEGRDGGNWRWICASLAVLACTAAYAQVVEEASESPPAAPIPYASLNAAPTVPTAGGGLKAALDAARSGDIRQATQLQAALADPLARRIVEWAKVDNAATSLTFTELDQARRDLAGWPHPQRRQAAAERALESASLSPTSTLDWFAGAPPQTAEGAMALASALRATGRGEEAKTLIRSFWRDHIFEQGAQAQMLTRFGDMLTLEDHEKRLSTLLYGPQGPATKMMMEMVPPDYAALAQARIALRADRDDASAYVAKVPEALANDSGLAFDRARYYRKRDLSVAAASLVRNFPQTAPADVDVASAVWTERRALMSALVRSGDATNAYQVASTAGLSSGPDYAEAEFFAGWIALTRLHNPQLADSHFSHILHDGASPITASRAYYWRGRAAEARGDAGAAKAFFSQGAAYPLAFYGQLSAEKVGIKTITVGADPVPTVQDRTQFNARDLVRAAKMLGDIGQTDMLRSFILAAAEQMSDAGEYALLFDLAKAYGQQDLAMRVARAGAVHGYFLPERAYPVERPSLLPGSAELAFALGITRQESNFDPRARSPYAVGMMQLRPQTAQTLARRLGMAYSASRLTEPEFNMRLGSAFLGHLIDGFGGSYVMAAAAYNAGPNRPSAWAGVCGDPRTSAVDPVDFIECIPFPETRNYVMRTLEATQVYRARLSGGAAPLTLAEDLRRGAWTAPSTGFLTGLSQGPTSNQ